MSQLILKNLTLDDYNVQDESTLVMFIGGISRHYSNFP